MAYDFNGTNQYVATSASPVSASGSPVTLYALSSNDTFKSGGGVIIAMTSSNTNTGVLLLYSYGATESNYSALSQNAAGFNEARVNQSFATWPTGQWRDASAYFASNASRVVNVVANTFSASNGISRESTGMNSVCIGGGNYNNSTATFNDAKIAEAAIWTAALTPEEMVSLQKGFKPSRIRPQSLVFYAPLMRNLQDLRGGLEITNFNSAPISIHPRVY